MVNRSFLSRTGQLWKLTAGILCMAVGLAIIVTIVHFEVSSETGIPGVASGLAFTVGGFFWMMLSIRCPSCKSRVIWKAARQNEASGWLAELLQKNTCPVCGFDAVVNDRP
jgi:hypothetical protein